MKKLMTLAFVFAMLLSALTLGIAADNALPEIPTGAYSVKASAIRLTTDTAVGVTQQSSKAVRIVPTLTAGSIDISEKQYIYVWIYVSDETLLYDNNGDSIELCSGGNRDTEESAINFYYDKAITPTINFDYARLDRGWNEYLIKLDDFQVLTGGELNRKALNYIGFVMRSKPEGLTFAIGPMYAVSMEDLDYDGSAITSADTDAATTPEQTLPPLITEPVTTPRSTTATPATAPAPDTTASPKSNDTTTAAPEGKGGCASSASLLAIVPMMTFCAAVTFKRRK